MSKKSLDRKKAQKFIVEQRANGKSDQEIYDELTQQYYDKKEVALFIAGTATEENKRKYKIYNNTLLIFLLAAILLRILSVFGMTLQTGQLWTLLFVFIVPVFAALFAHGVAMYQAPIYRFCGIMTILGFLKAMSSLESGIDIFINFIFTVAIAGLAFYLDSKLFPNYRPRSLKTDSNGEYILD